MALAHAVICPTDRQDEEPEGKHLKRDESLYDIIDGAIYDAELLKIARAETPSASTGSLGLDSAKTIWAAVDDEGDNLQIWEASLRTISYIVKECKLDFAARTFLQEAVKSSVRFWRDREKVEKLTAKIAVEVPQTGHPQTPLKRIRPQRSLQDITSIEHDISEAKSLAQINAAMRELGRWKRVHDDESGLSPPKPVKKPKTRVRLVDGEKYDADLLELVESKVQLKGQGHPIDLRVVKELCAKARVAGTLPPTQRRSLEYISEEFELNDSASDYIDNLLHTPVRRASVPRKGDTLERKQKCAGASEIGWNTTGAEVEMRPTPLQPRLVSRRRLHYKQRVDAACFSLFQFAKPVQDRHWLIAGDGDVCATSSQPQSSDPENMTAK